MPVLSFANLMVPDTNPLEQIDAAASAGFDAVGLCLHPPDRIGARLVHDSALRRNVKDRLDERNIKVLDVEVFRLEPQSDISALAPTLAAGADLGARFVLVVGNDPNEERAMRNYAKLCDLAGALGLRAMLEFISYRPLRDIRQAERWLRQVNHPSAGMCVDALHLFRSGGTLAELQQVDPRLIGYAQLCDAASLQPAQDFTEEQLLRESRLDRRLPGQGVLPLAAFLDALPSGLEISVEAPCEAYAHLSPRELATLAKRTTLEVIAQSALS